MKQSPVSFVKSESKPSKPHSLAESENGSSLVSKIHESIAAQQRAEEKALAEATARVQADARAKQEALARHEFEDTAALAIKDVSNSLLEIQAEIKAGAA